MDALRSYIDQAPDGTSIIIKTNPERPKKQTNSGEDESQGTFLQTQTNMLPCPQSILTANVSRHHRPNTECNSGLGSHAALHDKRPIILTPTLTEGAAPATFSTTQTLLELPIFKSPRPDTPMPPRATETSDPAGRTPFMQNTEQLIHHDNSMTAAQDFNIQTDLHRYMLSQPETQQTQQAYMTDTDGLEASIKVVDAEQTQFSPSIVQRVRPSCTSASTHASIARCTQDSINPMASAKRRPSGRNTSWTKRSPNRPSCIRLNR